MSGPKYSPPPPPRYSVSAFNGELNHIFSIQRQITQLWEQLARCEFQDAQRHIQFDCQAFIESYQRSYEEAVQPFNIFHAGTFGQARYDRYQREITQKKRRLNQVRNELLAEKNRFLALKEDYKAYLEYENYHHRVGLSFAEWKVQFCEEMSKRLVEFPEVKEKGVRQINQVEIKPRSERFYPGFSGGKSRAVQGVNADLQQAKDQVHDIRKNVGKEVVGKMSAEAFKSFGKAVLKPVLPMDCKQYATRIMKVIDELGSAELQVQFKKELTDMQEDEVRHDTDYFRELYNEVKKVQILQKRKEELRKLEEELKTLSLHEECLLAYEQWNKLVREISQKSNIKSRDLEEVVYQAQQLIQDSEARQQSEWVIQQERLFLKRQLINQLSAMNYEVMEDLEVVDFEKNKEFIFNIPQQENYLSIQYREDGSFSYNFFIPEDKNQLSSAELKAKLVDMQSACDDFDTVLSELNALGLPIRIGKEKPATAETLMQLPERIRTQLPEKEQTRIEVEQQRKRTLNKDNT
ncbi:MAG: hypothetical protein AAFR61_20260 [Bacteroidota bacterium]